MKEETFRRAITLDGEIERTIDELRRIEVLRNDTEYSCSFGTSPELSVYVSHKIKIQILDLITANKEIYLATLRKEWNEL